MRLVVAGSTLMFLIFMAVGIYYLTPGVNHALVLDEPAGQHINHAVLCFGLGLLALIGARIAASSRTAHESPD